MSEISTHTTLHSRMSCFVDWIAPDPDKIDDIAERADKARKYLQKCAEEDGLTVTDTPKSGSFEKKTGLRRHYLGHCEIDGLDVDIPMVIKPKDDEGDLINELLNKFEKYVIKFKDNLFSAATVKKTKSSVKITFSDEVSFDIVPMLATAVKNEQILIRSTGERIKTSVQKHNDFVKGRTKKSNEEAGRVKFNECIRLIKWWRDIQSADGYYLADDNAPPSIVIDLLCAAAFDKLGVYKTYGETLSKWYSYMASLVRNKRAIFFTDNYSAPTIDPSVTWTVLDPVNPDNNITKNWNTSKANELADWFETGRDNWARIIHFDEDEEDAKCLDELVLLFGNPFKNHCSK
jgi:hypothetical protein